MNCPRCKGTRHFRTERGWARCDCVKRVLGAAYVKRSVMGNDAAYPESYASKTPLPLADQLSIGEQSYDDFRYSVWRSLEEYSERNLSYEFLDASRVIEIYFQRDGDYESLRDLVRLDLLVLVFGEFCGPNKLMPDLIGQVLDQRRRDGRPTWVFSALTRNRFASVYTADVLRVLGGERIERKAETSQEVETAASAFLSARRATPNAGRVQNAPRPDQTSQQTHRKKRRP